MVITIFYFHGCPTYSTFGCGLELILFITLRVEVSPVVVSITKTIHGVFNFPLLVIDDNHKKINFFTFGFQVSASYKMKY
jgi:hypothetical protein